ncbi:MAG: hypothetical protein GX061_05800 [Eubacteriaceae bacterium]|nr:hypothetical protein [Eubacteriaceae bacterium]
MKKRDIPNVPNTLRLNEKLNAALKEINEKMDAKKTVTGESLWRGLWNGGRIRVKGSAAYGAFMMNIGGVGVMVVKSDNHTLSGSGGGAAPGGGVVEVAFKGTYDGENMTYTAVYKKTSPTSGQDTTVLSDEAVREIVGLW